MPYGHRTVPRSHPRKRPASRPVPTIVHPDVTLGGDRTPRRTGHTAPPHHVTHSEARSVRNALLPLGKQENILGHQERARAHQVSRQVHALHHLTHDPKYNVKPSTAPRTPELSPRYLSNFKPQYGRKLERTAETNRTYNLRGEKAIAKVHPYHPSIFERAGHAITHGDIVNAPAGVAIDWGKAINHLGAAATKEFGLAPHGGRGSVHEAGTPIDLPTLGRAARGTADVAANTLEHPVKSGKEFVHSLPGMVGGLGQLAVTPQHTGGQIVKDYKKRWGNYLSGKESHTKFEHRMDKNPLPYELDVFASGIPLSKGAGALARAAKAGRVPGAARAVHALDASRPDLRVASGISRPQRLSNNLFGVAAQRVADASRRRYTGKMAKANQHRPRHVLAEQAADQGQVIGRIPALRTARMTNARGQVEQVHRGRFIRERAKTLGKANRQIRKLLPKDARENGGFWAAVERGVRTPEQARKMVASERQRIEGARAIHELPGETFPHDVLKALDDIEANADKWFGPHVVKASRIARQAGARGRELDPWLHGNLRGRILEPVARELGIRPKYLADVDEKAVASSLRRQQRKGMKREMHQGRFLQRQGEERLSGIAGRPGAKQDIRRAGIVQHMERLSDEELAVERQKWAQAEKMWYAQAEKLPKGKEADLGRTMEVAALANRARQMQAAANAELVRRQGMGQFTHARSQLDVARRPSMGVPKEIGPDPYFLHATAAGDHAMETGRPFHMGNRFHAADIAHARRAHMEKGFGNGAKYSGGEIDVHRYQLKRGARTVRMSDMRANDLEDMVKSYATDEHGKVNPSKAKARIIKEDPSGLKWVKEPGSQRYAAIDEMTDRPQLDIDGEPFYTSARSTRDWPTLRIDVRGTELRPMNWGQETVNAFARFLDNDLDAAFYENAAEAGTARDLARHRATNRGFGLEDPQQSAVVLRHQAVRPPGVESPYRGNEAARASMEAGRYQPETGHAYRGRVVAGLRKEGRMMPGYFRHDTEPYTGSAEHALGHGQFAAGAHPSTTYAAFERGRHAVSSEAWAGGVARNLKRYFAQDFIQNMIRDFTPQTLKGAVWPKGPEVPDGLTYGARGLTWEQARFVRRRAAIDDKDFVLVNMHEVKKAIDDLPDPLSIHENFTDGLADVLNRPGVKLDPSAVDSATGIGGGRWYFMDRTAYESMAKAMKFQTHLVGRLARRYLKGLPSTLILNTNPSWLLLQVFNNQSLLALNGVAPTEMVAAFRDMQKLKAEFPEEYSSLMARAGAGSLELEMESATARLGGAQTERLKRSLPDPAERPIESLANFYENWKNSTLAPGGRFINLKMLYQGDVFNNWLARSMVARNQAQVLKWKGLDNAFKYQIGATDRLMASMAHPRVTPADYAQLIRDPKTFEDLGRATDDLLGNYSRFSATERTWLEGNIMFYGFLRFSLRFALYTLPLKHPILHSILNRLSALHEDEVRKLLHVGPNDPLPGYFLGNIYRVHNGHVTQLPLSRLNPVMNQITQATSAHPAQIAGMLSPFAVELIQQGLGMNLFTGKGYHLRENPRMPVGQFGLADPRFRHMTAEERGRIALRHGLEWMSPFRGWEEQTYSGRPTTEESLPWSPRYFRYRDPDTNASIAQGVRKRRKHAGEAITRNALDPVYSGITGNWKPSNARAILDFLADEERRARGKMRRRGSSSGGTVGGGGGGAGSVGGGGGSAGSVR